MENLFKTEERMATRFIKKILREDRELLRRVMALGERKSFIKEVRIMIACIYASTSDVRNVKEFFEKALYCSENMIGD